VAMCGDMAGDAMLTWVLVGLGLRHLSMAPRQIPVVKSIVRATRLADAVKSYPDQPVFAHGLARLLAAAPDDNVRDGARALALVQQLLSNEQRTPDLGETMAMALADVGRYEEAIQLQRDLIAGAERRGVHNVTGRLADNLALYERHQPCRMPWTDRDMP